jgi:hypothetical protein
MQIQKYLTSDDGTTQVFFGNHLPKGCVVAKKGQHVLACLFSHLLVFAF